MNAPSPSAPTMRRPGEHKGFVEEMRFVAMRLHTKDQAPREGKQEASALPIQDWAPSKHDFMQFLVDSRAVYTYFERELAVAQHAAHPMFTRFADTGLERLQSLDDDIAFLNARGVDTPTATSAATKYVGYLRDLLKEKPESVLCHWYNYYFAHSAGGRMIGRLMQDRLFEGHEFEFYKWESDVKEILNKVRVIIDQVASEWSRETKDECLKETGLAFGYSGTVLQNLAKASNR
ncbi:unnamed protein product [Agarophyton chilense]